MNRSVVIHHSTAWWRSHRATSRCTAGSVPRCRSGRGGKRVAWATPSRLVLSLPQLLPEQKAVCQHHGDGMPVETPPQPSLVLVPAQFPLGLFMELLDGMAAMGNVHQFLQGSRGRQVAPIVFALLWLTTSCPLSQQPAHVASPCDVMRQHRSATNFLRSQPLVPCRHRMVRHWHRGNAANTWSARCVVAARRRFRRTSKSLRTATT